MNKRKIILTIALSLIGVAMVTGLEVGQLTNVTYHQGTVTNLYIKNDDNRGEFYVVLDGDEVFKNSDSILYGKFDSADVQASLKVGDKVTLKTTGYRVPFISLYQNIISVRRK